MELEVLPLPPTHPLSLPPAPRPPPTTEHSPISSFVMRAVCVSVRALGCGGRARARHLRVCGSACALFFVWLLNIPHSRLRPTRATTLSRSTRCLHRTSCGGGSRPASPERLLFAFGSFKDAAFFVLSKGMEKSLKGACNISKVSRSSYGVVCRSSVSFFQTCLRSMREVLTKF